MTIPKSVSHRVIMSHMVLSFEKYSSTGNDFIVFDITQYDFDKISTESWSRLCHRKNGIGADGILLVGKVDDHLLSMKYFNSDGREEAMCANGARAAIHFGVNRFEIKSNNHIFLKTKNSTYQAKISGNEIELQMSEISDEGKIAIDDLFESEHSFYINTGVEHCVYLVEDVDAVNLDEIAPSIRHDKRFDRGSNVNFYHVISEFELKTRVFERGVEGETLACGTGAVAMGIAAFRSSGKAGNYKLHSKGGELKVRLNDDLSEVFLSGSTLETFSGSVDLSKFCE